MSAFHSAGADAFRLPSDLHYLNCAYMSPLPREVEAAGILGIRRKRNPSGIRPPDFFQETEELRSLYGGLLEGVESDSVAVLPAVSYGVAVAARNAGSLKGRNVVVARDQFPGNVYAWMAGARRQGGELRMVDPPPSSASGEGRGAGWSRRLAEAIDEQTAVVALGPVHWADGTRFDLEAVGARAREVGALLVVDATQSLGADPFPMTSVRPDAVISAAYKWLLGPYSMALGYFGERIQGGIPLEEGWITRAGSQDFRGLVDYTEAYAPGAIRYDVGERSNFILTPMTVAGLRLVHQWTPRRIREHCAALTGPLARTLREEGHQVEEERWRAPHILGVRLREGVDMERVRMSLEHRNVHVSLRGDAVRISPHVYNGPEDMAALVEGLREAAAGS